MKLPDKLKVEAIIPSAKNPNVHLTHRGRIPPAIVGRFAVGKSQEHMLHELGVQEFGLVLSVNEQLGRADIKDRHTGEVVNVSQLRTDPLDPQIDLPKQYGWYDTTKVINEFGDEVEIGWVDADGNPLSK